MAEFGDAVAEAIFGEGRVYTSLNGVHAIVSRRNDQAMFGTSIVRKTQQRGPFALQIFYTTPPNYPEAARYAPIRSE